MKVQTKLYAQSHDRCRPEMLEDACSLIGKAELSEEDRKPFGRVCGNDFTIEDVEQAVAVVHRRSGEMLE